MTKLFLPFLLIAAKSLLTFQHLGPNFVNQCAIGFGEIQFFVFVVYACVSKLDNIGWLESFLICTVYKLSLCNTNNCR